MYHKKLFKIISNSLACLFSVLEATLLFECHSILIPTVHLTFEPSKLSI